MHAVDVHKVALPFLVPPISFVTLFTPLRTTSPPHITTRDSSSLAAQSPCAECTTLQYLNTGAPPKKTSTPVSMSRRSRHFEFRSRGEHHGVDIKYPSTYAAMNEEQRITVCKTSISQIYAMLRTSPENKSNYLQLGRSVMAHLDTTTFMEQPSRTTEQAWVIAGLQQLAYMDADNGAVGDLAFWCSRQWLAISQRDPQNIAALRGIGQLWLSRAQPVLARIHRQEGSSSSSGGSSQRSAPSGNGTEQSSSNSRAEAERRVNTQDYVEARQYLQPATEYLERAVTAATAQRALSGDLLATAAEAYMSLGNTTSPRTNVQYFRRALQLLRAAENIQGYILSRYLQQYLNDYGRLID